MKANDLTDFESLSKRRWGRIDNLKSNIMDEHLKQQIDDWNGADEYQLIIDALEEIPPSERNFEVIGQLARAYNNIGKYETALTLLRSTRDEGEGDTDWNFRMGYALYYLEREKEALSYFKKAYELMPGDEDTIDFIRHCNIEMSFRHRVYAFRQWFMQHEAELSDMVERSEEYGGDTIVSFIDRGTELLAEHVHFNMGGKHEFTFSVERNKYLFYLYSYLISRMLASLKDKWHFFPFNQGTDVSFEFRMAGVQVNMEEVAVEVYYDATYNDFSLSYYEKNLAALPEDKSCNMFWIMMEVVLGEGLSAMYISDVKRLENPSKERIPLLKLCKYLTDTLKKYGK